MKVIPLSDRGTVSIAGADASALLQGLVTCDVTQIQRAGIAYGALLTPQGKLLFDFILHGRGAAFVADLPLAAVEGFIKRLRMYKLRAKVDLEDCSEHLSVVQVPGEGDSGLDRVDPRHPGLGRRLVCAPEALETLAGGASAHAPLAAYHAARIGLTIPEAPYDFDYGEVFPHDVALDALAGIAFKKGCYIGQEVVSRMQHRGTARRRVVRVDGEEDLPEPGTEILAGDRAIGALGSHSAACGIAIVRLDRARAAQIAGVDMLCGGRRVVLSIPDWASYSWPQASSAAE